jgi:hypothetical protein
MTAQIIQFGKPQPQFPKKKRSQTTEAAVLPDGLREQLGYIFVALSC